MNLRISLFACATLLAPLTVHADYLDVIATKLNADCSLEQYVSIADEFRGVMKSQKYKYTVEVAVPFVGEDLSMVYWIGREPDLGTFGQENDRWAAAVAKAGTPEAKVNAKIAACSVNVSRTGSHTR
jgi:hypothetical protein